MRFVYWFASLVMALCCWQQAYAQTPVAVKLSVTVYGNGVAVAGLSAAQIAASPASNFSPFDDRKIYAPEFDKPIWLRLSVDATSAQAANVWSLEFNKQFIDKVVLHTLQNDGQWLQQSSGDQVKHTLWVRQSLTPQFYLPELRMGQRDMYVELYNSVPLRHAVTLLSTDAANVQTQNALFLGGILAGLLILLCIASAVFCVAYRDAASFWYAAYVAFALLLSVSYMGLGNYALWADWLWLRQYCHTIFISLVFASQLQFCRVIFLPAKTPFWMRCAVNAVSVLCVALIVPLTVITHSLTFQVLFAALTFTVLCTAAAVVISNVHRQPLMAKFWIAAYAPLVLPLIFSISENMGYQSVPWMPYNAPLYALLFEIPVLLIALNLHIKNNHAHGVRLSTLATTDPMTGFITSRFFTGTGERLWNEAKASAHDLAVAYVEATPDMHRSAMPHTHDSDRQLLRTVRLLRTVVRDADTVAHIDDNVFAILMPDVSIGEDFTGRLSRLVALGWMTDKDHPASVPVRFRVVASTLRSFEGPWPALDAALHQKFSQEKGWEKRSIRFVKKEVYQPISAEDISQFWELATTASARLKGAHPQLSQP
jgi:GGDEF domain-containing protein